MNSVAGPALLSDRDEQDDHDSDSRRVAHNLQRLRAKRYLSLDALARLSGVSRAMLAQIESGRSVPSIKTLCRIARGLRVSVAAFLDQDGLNGVQLLPARHSPRVNSADGNLISRPLFPAGQRSGSEFHELRFKALGEVTYPALQPGARKNLVVSQGVLQVGIHEDAYLLSPGDALMFYADQPHLLRNPADSEALVYLVTSYPETYQH